MWIMLSKGLLHRLSFFDMVYHCIGANLCLQRPLDMQARGSEKWNGYQVRKHMGTLHTTTSFPASILCSSCLDPYIGHVSVLRCICTFSFHLQTNEVGETPSLTPSTIHRNKEKILSSFFLLCLVK
jgi:hypothetical protein